MILVMDSASCQRVASSGLGVALSGSSSDPGDSELESVLGSVS